MTYSAMIQALHHLRLRPMKATRLRHLPIVYGMRAAVAAIYHIFPGDGRNGPRAAPVLYVSCGIFHSSDVYSAKFVFRFREDSIDRLTVWEHSN